jgi:hypothetical protein
MYGIYERMYGTLKGAFDQLSAAAAAGAGPGS